MSVEGYRQLVALRYAAESIDEVNMFLARALELQVRHRRRGATDRIAAYLGGGAAVLVSIFTIGEAFLVPGLILAGYLGLMGSKGLFDWWNIWRENQELLLDHESLRNYLHKATRDRFENKVSVAIQNRKAAASLLKEPDKMSAEEREWLEQCVQFWGERIKACAGALEACGSSQVWKDHQDLAGQLSRWIDAELTARPIAAADR